MNLVLLSIQGLKTGDAHFTPEQAATDYKTLKDLLDEKFGENNKQLLTLSGNWEFVFMQQFTELFNDFDGVAWHWYPLGPGNLAYQFLQIVDSQNDFC